jgi:hypothetical protein
MSTKSKHSLSVFVFMLALDLCAAPGFAQTWRAMQDAKGWTWARVTFVNESTNVSNWTVWNCRTAVTSTVDRATSHPRLNWDGVVNPEETQIVWVYVMDAFSEDVHIDNADGGPSAYRGAYTPSLTGDSEWVIMITTDSTVRARLVTGAAYEAPIHTGSYLDPATAREQ